MLMLGVSMLRVPMLRMSMLREPMRRRATRRRPRNRSRVRRSARGRVLRASAMLLDDQRAAANILHAHWQVGH
ncbi:hypothetical protein [Burkholderia multivorans]|uniref:hypothetical protein n=1 Tax=Burkholderia multivorans TaxID=87883 RepID=UPI0015E43C5E|nr:hypothetical protein [Burkholderia multivorans]